MPNVVDLLRPAGANADCEVRTLQGPLSEETDLSHLLEGAGSPLILDMSGVTRVNSCGVRTWLEFVRALEDGGRSLVLRRCPPHIVLQVNLIYDFVGTKGTIESIFAPYLCDACGAETHHLVDLSTLTGPEQLPLERPCGECGSVASFADVPKLYLSFLAHR